MKVGTDGVLLGAWCGVAGLTPRDAVLDVGCGTGVIALMIAQRCAAGRIDAVDIDPESAAEASQNFTGSPWMDRLRAYCGAFQSFVPVNGTRYNYIVSNPPYFINSLKNPDRGRTLARHADALPYTDLLEGIGRLLSAEGKFSVVLPAAESEVFEKIAGRQFGFSPVRRLCVRSVPGQEVRRVLSEFSGKESGCETEALVIEAPDRKDFSDEYKKLTGDFYLKF